MTAFIAQITSGDTPQGSIQFKSLFAVAIVLFVITLVLNLLSNWFVAATGTSTHDRRDRSPPASRPLRAADRPATR